MKISAKMRKPGALYALTGKLFNPLLIRQLMRVSGLAIILSLITFQVLLATTGKGQNMATEKVTVGLQHESLATGIKRIEEQSTLRFFYRRTDIKMFSNLNFPVGTRTVQETLGELLKNTFFTFRQIDNKILLEKDIQTEYIINGRVIDIDHKPIELATVGIIKTDIHKLIQTIKTDSTGKFKLSISEKGDYLVKISKMSMDSLSVAITLGEMRVIELPDITLVASHKQLQEVVITSTKPLIRQEIDRIAYDVQSDPDSKSMSALEIMQKVPLLSVDANNQIKLKGSGSYKILINNRESALVAKDPSDILMAMPASNIEKIEVITIPPAKYDAEGLVGIINIITKRNISQGYKIGVNGRYNNLAGPDMNVNGTLKQGKLGLAVFGGYTDLYKQKRYWNNEQDFYNQSKLLQNSNYTSDGNNQHANAELSYEIDSLNLLTATMELMGNKLNRVTDQTSAFNVNNSLLNQQYNLLANNNGNSTGFGTSINYQLGVSKQKKRLLTLSYNYNYMPSQQITGNQFLERLNYSQQLHPDYQQYDHSGNKENTIQVDYVHPLKKVTIEAGAKAIFRNNFSDYHLYEKDSITQVYIPNASQANNFNYQQNVLSAYNSYQVAGNKWAAKAGFRFEHTSTNADFSSVGTKVNQEYDNLIPSISIQRMFNNNKNVNLGFTERIQRPGITQLNPFIDRSNPQIIYTGNPNLHPELNHVFQLSYSSFSKNTFYAQISYMFINNAINSVSLIKAESQNGHKDTVTINSYQNIGNNRMLTFYLGTTLSISKELTIAASGQLFRTWLEGTYNGQSYKNAGYTGNAYINIAYDINTTYRIGTTANYDAGVITLQGRQNNGANILTSYVFSKKVFNKKGTISIVANNPYSKFYTYYKSTLNTNDFYQSTYFTKQYRNFAIRFNYSFGKLKSELKKNQRGINNDDVKSSEKNANDQN